MQTREAVNPLDLLDNDSGFYLKIPTAADADLVAELLQKYADGLSAEDAAAAKRIDTVYAGLNRSRHSTDFQIAAACSIPKIAVSKIFSKKNGWNQERIPLPDPSGAETTYTVFSRAALRAAFPSERIAVVGRGVPSMVGQYHALSFHLEETPQPPLDGRIYSWLSVPETDIRFFAAKPLSFLTVLTGANLNFKLAYACGILAASSRRNDQYIMQLEFEFRDSRIVPAAKGALGVAFGLTDSNIVQDSATHLTVSHINIQKEQLRAMLAL